MRNLFFALSSAYKNLIIYSPLGTIDGISLGNDDGIELGWSEGTSIEKR